MVGELMNNYVLIALYIGLCSNIIGCSTQASNVDSSHKSASHLSKINIHNENHKNGIYDISIEYDKQGIGWMAYSRVELPKYVETHIAKSHDRGKTWRYVMKVNPSKDGAHKQKRRVWRNETPTLLYDPTDSASRQWKLFSHRYPAKPPYKKGSHLYAEGWIEYKVANIPQGPWSKPIRLFGSRENNSRISINMLHPSLKDMQFYNEMGSIVIDGVIYLSLDTSPTANGLGKWKKRKIILIASKDHGQSWGYVGDLTNHNDAADLGYLVLTGSSLVLEKNKIFLLLSPSGAKGLFKKNRSHDGTLVVEVLDIAKAKLKRGVKGELVIKKWLKPTLESGGLSDYDEQNSAGGIIFSQIDTSVKSIKADFFQVFNTGKTITD